MGTKNKQKFPNLWLFGKANVSPVPYLIKLQIYGSLVRNFFLSSVPH